MAFGVEELRVLRRALALALHSGPASAGDVQDCFRLAESLDEAVREGARLRAFLVADLARYRAALPGTASGYLTLLEEVLGAGYRPTGDDLAALRALRGNPLAAALLDRCEALAGPDARARVTRVPAARTRLLALPGGAAAEARDEGQGKPAPGPVRKPPAEKPAHRPRPPERPAERPGEDPEAPKRPIPTPGEVFPRRRPTPPPANPSRRLAVG
ncbi:hypothetical protein [Streptomyces sp. NPDC006739]|uniref:hypothetical protein n=1 Tax=Streptomyces sp. NPDC006739 TaxID=3364763 RepID=UPI003679ACED